MVGLACRSVRELEDMDFESEPVGVIVEEHSAIVEVSATCQSVRLQKGDINPVIKEVNVDGPTSVWGMSVEEVINAKTKDEDLDIIRQWLEGTGSPSDGGLFLASPGAKFYGINWDMVKIMDCILYFRKTNGDGWDMILPESLKGEAVRLNHDLSSS